jgi:hypothetical protein
MMRLAVLLPILLALSACEGAGAGAANAAATAENAAPSGKIAAAPACAAGEKPLPLSGLCQAQAAALLLDPGGASAAAMEGCQWVIRETPVADDLLLYRTLRCGETETTLAFDVGNHMSELRYASRVQNGAITDADGKPLLLAKVFAGHPDGRARALFEARDGVEDKAAAKSCDLRPPWREGYPADALIVDIARTPADLERDDAAPACGPYGYSPMAEIFAFWRTHQGFAWYMELGTDVWDVDPSSLTLIHRSDAGAWEPLPTPPPA